MRLRRTPLTVIVAAALSAVLLTVATAAVAAAQPAAGPARAAVRASVPWNRVGAGWVLTPPRRASSGDLGDLDAWQLPGGLYLQAAGPCAVLQIFKQSAAGSITRVTVPGTAGDNRVLTALGSRLMVQAPTSCTGSVSLLWFNPATRAEQWLLRAPANVTGASIAIPFYSREDGDL